MNLYDNKYFSQVEGTINPEEQNWKFKKVSPALAKFLEKTGLYKIKLIEIGAGSGFFVKNLKKTFRKNKFAVTALEVNKHSTRYLDKILPKKQIVISDISTKTKFKNKNFDLCVGIDVLEHIENLDGAIKEIKRISEYAIFKIPIEKSLGIRFINFISAKKYRKNIIATVGHIHWFSNNEIISFMKNNFSQVEHLEYTNIGLYQYRKNLRVKKPRKILLIIWYFLSSIIFRISKRANAILFGDHLIVLVKC